MVATTLDLRYKTHDLLASLARGVEVVITYRGKKIRIVSIPAHQLLLETEGETLTNSPFDFEILPSSINMVIPEKTEQLNN